MTEFSRMSDVEMISEAVRELAKVKAYDAAKGSSESTASLEAVSSRYPKSPEA